MKGNGEELGAHKRETVFRLRGMRKGCLIKGTKTVALGMISFR